MSAGADRHRARHQRRVARPHDRRRTAGCSTSAAATAAPTPSAARCSGCRRSPASSTTPTRTSASAAAASTSGIPAQANGTRQQRRDARRHARRLRRRRAGRRAHRPGRPQDGVRPARHHGRAGLHRDRPHLPAVLPELQPEQHAARPAASTRRISKMSRPRISRFTIDLETKQLDLDSEVRIFEYDAQIYSCCHVGGGMGFDSEGNLYVTTGDTNSSQGSERLLGQQPGRPSARPARTTSPTQRALRHRELLLPGRAPDRGQHQRLQRQDAAVQADRHRGRRRSRRSASARRTRCRPRRSPNGPNLFDGTEGGGGKAKPEIYAMGLRNPSRLSIDPETDVPYTAWVGPDAGAPSATLGPSTYENASQIDRAGNYGWPYCMGNGQAYRDRPPDGSRARPTRPATSPAARPPAAPTAGTTATTCATTRPTTPVWSSSRTRPAPGMDAGTMRRDNLWWTAAATGNAERLPGLPARPRRGNAPELRRRRRRSCARTCSSDGLTVMNGPVYRYDDGRRPTTRAAGPTYWDGRWFLHNNGGPSVKHGLLLDPDDRPGRRPAGLRRQPAHDAAVGTASYMDSKFGPTARCTCRRTTGSSAPARTSASTASTTPAGRRRRGANPTASSPIGALRVQFSSAGSGGVSYEWDFGDGETSTEANPTHTLRRGRHYTAQADRHLRGRQHRQPETSTVDVLATSDDDRAGHDRDDATRRGPDGNAGR